VIEVVELLYNRVEAKIAVTKYKDITPLEETHAFKSAFHSPVLKRDRGAGRPTKRDRREIDDLTDNLFEDQ
jgi:ribosome-associated heat shock protein Hsp15